MANSRTIERFYFDASSPTYVIRHPLAYPVDSAELFKRFCDAEQAVFLDSGSPESNKGRYDIISAWPSKLLTLSADTCTFRSDGGQKQVSLSEARALLSTSSEGDDNEIDLPFTGGWIGFASYELGYLLEPKSGEFHSTNEELPLLSAGYYDWAIIIDHHQKKAELVFTEDASTRLIDQVHCALDTSPTPLPEFHLTSPFQCQTDKPTYQAHFDRIQEYLLDGDCYQVNYALQYKGGYEGSSYAAYQTLRNTVPSGFMAYINQSPTSQILSISPERFIRSRAGHLETKPIKGTAPRFTDPSADKASVESLLNSEKNRAENVMIVDLLRNDLSHHCKPNSVRVSQLCELETYANVHHLVSTVEGDMDEASNIWDVFLDAFPGGSITGAPKIRACQIIRELEAAPRAIYCGSVFYASNNGRFDSSITIRTLLCQNANISAWAGGGIVRDSEVDDEYDECEAKIGHLLKAITPEKWR